MAQRVLDPEYLEAYRQQLVDRLNFVTEKCELLRSGNQLGVEPGFGLLDSSQESRRQYTDTHEVLWDNLQKLRVDLYGAIVTINESLGVHTDAEELNIAEVSSFEQ
ncbi:hypothetical protein [Glycomyces buryatensis]|uniref:Uncharacterized protein n=1 Tax=Glycomyces buryatensis TaxID=2570927 RepID=A0A4V4HSN1_9ACTN|nr:hypothetical protein [Glycomyces buryatensis]THV42266.1 hypothetical protein FAB82_07245 [Glycomyces buryatensis]